MKRSMSLALSTVILITLFVSISAIPAKCATSGGITTLKPNVVYSSYDFTGNGKKDRFKFKPCGKNGDYYNKIEISVNGKIAYQQSGDYYYNTTLKLLTLSNGKKFLFVNTVGDNEDGPLKAVLQYKNGKYVKVLDFNKILGKHGGHHNVYVSSVKGTAVTFKVFLMSWSVGNSYYSMQYAYQSGTLKQNSSAARLISVNLIRGNTRTLYVNKTINVYTTASTNQRAFVLHYGDKVTIDQCRISSTRMLLRVKYGNRYGWIIAASKYPVYQSDKQFQEVGFAA